jgi:hypothetical protein
MCQEESPPKKTRLQLTLLNTSTKSRPEGFMDAGSLLSYNPSNPILVAYAADLSVREVYLDHIFR